MATQELTKKGTARVRAYPKERVYSTFKYRLNWEDETGEAHTELFMSAPQIAEFLGLHRNTIGRWLKRGFPPKTLKSYSIDNVSIPAEIKRVVVGVKIMEA